MIKEKFEATIFELWNEIIVKWKDDESKIYLQNLSGVLVLEFINFYRIQEQFLDELKLQCTFYSEIGENSRRTCDFLLQRQ